MGSLRRITLIFACMACGQLAPAIATADSLPLDPLGFQFSSPSLIVHENAGSAQITVQRLDTAVGAQVRYVTMGIAPPPGLCAGMVCTAVSPYDFRSVKGELDFAPGQASATFSVPIVDHHTDSVSKTLQVSLFGAHSTGMGSPSTAVLTIINDDPPIAHDAADPLGIAGAGIGGNPLAGAKFFVDHQNEPSVAARQYPQWARWLNMIASQPGTARFGSFSFGSFYVPDIGTGVSRYLTRAAAQEPGTVPLLATYRLLYGHCGNWSDPPSAQASYHNFIQGFAAGIGSYRAVLFLEMDSLITSPCLTQQGLTVRMNELRDAINILTANCPRLVIYLDAGAADAVQARPIANLLRRAGVAKIQGFFLNSTHFDWTKKEIRFGNAISRLTGGKHFVINTGEGGQGPLIPRDRVHQGNEVLCNPPGRGLGPLPTTHTGYPNVDMFAWTSNPGESGGPCVPGAPLTGVYWPQYAMGLAQHANFSVR
jgi:endoglucanase